VNSPSQVLHVSNLADGVTESQLRELFGADQGTAPTVQFFKNDRKMAYVRMETPHDAVLALIKLHNYKLTDRYMRVSFSTKQPTQVLDSDASDGVGVE